MVPMGSPNSCPSPEKPRRYASVLSSAARSGSGVLDVREVQFPGTHENLFVQQGDDLPPHVENPRDDTPPLGSAGHCGRLLKHISGDLEHFTDAVHKKSGPCPSVIKDDDLRSLGGVTATGNAEAHPQIDHGQDASTHIDDTPHMGRRLGNKGGRDGRMISRTSSRGNPYTSFPRVKVTTEKRFSSRTVSFSCAFLGKRCREAAGASRDRWKARLRVEEHEQAASSRAKNSRHKPLASGILRRRSGVELGIAERAHLGRFVHKKPHDNPLEIENDDLSLDLGITDHAEARRQVHHGKHFVPKGDHALHVSGRGRDGCNSAGTHDLPDRSKGNGEVFPADSELDVSSRFFHVSRASFINVLGGRIAAQAPRNVRPPLGNRFDAYFFAGVSARPAPPPAVTLKRPRRSRRRSAEPAMS